MRRPGFRELIVELLIGIAVRKIRDDCLIVRAETDIDLHVLVVAGGVLVDSDIPNVLQFALTRAVEQMQILPRPVADDVAREQHAARFHTAVGNGKRMPLPRERRCTRPAVCLRLLRVTHVNPWTVEPGDKRTADHADRDGRHHAPAQGESAKDRTARDARRQKGQADGEDHAEHFTLNTRDDNDAVTIDWYGIRLAEHAIDGVLPPPRLVKIRAQRHTLTADDLLHIPFRHVKGIAHDDELYHVFPPL